MHQSVFPSLLQNSAFRVNRLQGMFRLPTALVVEFR